ncbi:MAG TPA: DUF4388 domain-containing protein [Coriobacteriia bacterium]|nr:DUF4388 domain-containing protein [Coriobacteriia bacterium]
MPEVHVALEGNLKDFSLSDMFRLLQSGSKSGVLHVVGTDGEGAVCFSEGKIFYASVNRAIEPAAKRLSHSGIISEKQLRQAQGLMKIQKKDRAGRKLGQILVDEGYLDIAVLEDFVREQASDALFDLLRWHEGTLRFESEETCAEADLGIGVSVDEAMADAGKRLELWHRILEKIPSVDTRFEMSALPGVNNLDIHLKPREWMLLCYLHGGRSVRELVKLTGYSDFETARILYGMYANGLIEKVGPSGEKLGE